MVRTVSFGRAGSEEGGAQPRGQSDRAEGRHRRTRRARAALSDPVDPELRALQRRPPRAPTRGRDRPPAARALGRRPSIDPIRARCVLAAMTKLTWTLAALAILGGT